MKTLTTQRVVMGLAVTVLLLLVAGELLFKGNAFKVIALGLVIMALLTRRWGAEALEPSQDENRAERGPLERFAARLASVARAVCLTGVLLLVLLEVGQLVLARFVETAEAEWHTPDGATVLYKALRLGGHELGSVKVQGPSSDSPDAQSRGWSAFADSGCLVRAWAATVDSPESVIGLHIPPGVPSPLPLSSADSPMQPVWLWKLEFGRPLTVFESSGLGSMIGPAQVAGVSERSDAHVQSQ